MRLRLIFTRGAGARTPAKKNADPDRGGHSTKCDQAKNKKSPNFEPFKVRGNLAKIKKNCISPQTAVKQLYT